MGNKYIDDEQDFEMTKTVQEVADLLGVHWQTVLKYIRDGKLEAFQMGNRYRIPASAYKSFLKNGAPRTGTPILRELKNEIKPLWY